MLQASSPTTAPITAARSLDRSPDPFGQRKGGQQTAVVAHGQQASEQAENEKQDQLRPATGGEVCNLEVQRIAQQAARHGDRTHRRAKGDQSDARVEAAHQFFQHEDRAGAGRVEGRRKAGSGTARDQCAAVLSVATKQPSDHVCRG